MKIGHTLKSPTNDGDEVSFKQGGVMNKNLRPRKLALKVETLRLLEENQLPAANGGQVGITTITTTIFSEGACEGYSWVRAC